MKCQSLACPECGEITSILTEPGDLVIRNGELQLLQCSYDGRNKYIPFRETSLEIGDLGECGNCGESFRLEEFIESQE
jgi:hypothetical protein